MALGVRDLTNTAKIVEPTIAHLAPVQTVCNYATLWFRNVASLLSEGDANGTSQRSSSSPRPRPQQRGRALRRRRPTARAPTTTCTPTRTRTPRRRPAQECEASNEPYEAGRQQIGNVDGNQGTQHDVTTISRGGTQGG